MNSIRFRDLNRQYKHIKDGIDKRLFEIIESTSYISGPEVKELERVLADYVGRKHCITCANGTDAISIGLMAAGVGEGDAVFVPDFTFFSSGECPASVGATPIFVDVDLRTYNISVESLESAIETVISEGKLLPKAVVAVDLFGQPFDYDGVKSVCDRYNLLLLEDAAQGFGGRYTSSSGREMMAGKLGQITTTSFFPAKPLGCYGDGGAIFTDDDEVNERLRSLRAQGKSPIDKYDNREIGMNSRLDTIQAAILLPKLKTFVNHEIDDVNNVASWYSERLKEQFVTPTVLDGFVSS